MSAAPITIKLRCTSWAQLKSIYKRDLARNALFLKSAKPPAIGTPIRVDLTLPSDSLIVLKGRVGKHVPPGGLGGRGPGIDLALEVIPQSAMWLIEQALSSATTDESAPRPLPKQSLAQAERAKHDTPAAAPDPAAAPAMESGAHIVEAEAELITALQDELASLRKLNPYQILGVGPDTTDEAVRAAFGELTRRYHPDRFARYQSHEARAFASEIFILVRDAYRKLGTERARVRTLQALNAQQASTPTRGARSSRAETAPAARPALVSGPPQAPAFTPRAQSSPPFVPVADEPLGTEMFGGLETGAGAEPIDLGDPGTRLDARRHAEAEALLNADDFEGAVRSYRMAAARDPGDRLARAGLELGEGLKALAQRNRLEAAQRFEAVLELDPANERAARELADMRRVATNERKGLLARLLGKKE
jgi:curved DNA-binding protein CbpA